MADSSTTSTGNLLQTLSDDLARSVEQAGASIVRVEGRTSNPASGIIWSADGLILTAHHVLEREDNIAVVLADGRSLSATIAGRDPGSDLALLRVPATGLAAAAQAPADAARLGSIVLAIGRPYALAATLGVVSTVGGPWRTWRGGQIERLIQTDAPFYHGFSGGALINPAGQILGLVSSQLGRGLNLAVPADLAAGIVSTLLSHGRVRKGYLGLGAQPVALPASLRQRLGLSQETGLLLVTLEPNAPADQAGLLVGDILIGLSDTPLTTVDDLQARLGGEQVGATTTARVIRGGALHDVSVTVGERAPKTAA
jgi:S1-C subfamily serine protease